MIVFCGEFSEAAKKVMLRILSKAGFEASVITATVFTALLVVVSVITDLWVIMLFEIALLFIVFLGAAAPYLERKEALERMLPIKISIDDEFVHAIWVDCEMTKKVTEVKRVLQIDNCYYIVFQNPKLKDVLCETNLLTVGDIDCFENIFRGKIKRIK